jgi:hypothetical protein
VSKSGSRAARAASSQPKKKSRACALFAVSHVGRIAFVPANQFRKDSGNFKGKSGAQNLTLKNLKIKENINW